MVSPLTGMECSTLSQFVSQLQSRLTLKLLSESRSILTTFRTASDSRRASGRTQTQGRSARQGRSAEMLTRHVLSHTRLTEEAFPC